MMAGWRQTLVKAQCRDNQRDDDDGGQHPAKQCRSSDALLRAMREAISAPSGFDHRAHVERAKAMQRRTR
jgi:hypothetical protein